MKTQKKILAVLMIFLISFIVSCQAIKDFFDKLPKPTPSPLPTVTPTIIPIPLPTITPTPTIIITPTPSNTIIVRQGFDGVEIQDGQFNEKKTGFYGIENNWFIRYLNLPTIPSGFVEFSVKGMEQETEEFYKAVLLTMWSLRDGYGYEDAQFIFELRKYGYVENNHPASNALRLKVKSGDIWGTSSYASQLIWDAQVIYHFRVEWRQEEIKVFRNGSLVLTGVYHGEFEPVEHTIQIGAQPLRPRPAPGSLWVSDVIIGRL